MDKAIIKFNPKLPNLTITQQKVLKLLIEAAELISPIYLEQEDQMRKLSDFFHNKTNKTIVEKEIKNNPEIRSPYTLVEKINGKIISTPYHIKYKEQIKPIADKLNKAAEITENKQFGKFLKLKVQAMLEGKYEEPIAYWMKMKPYILDITIGPFEHHDDRLFHSKASYQAWVGVVDPKATKLLEFYKQIVLSARRKALLPSERLENFHDVKTKVDNVLIFSGHMARTQFVGVNMPMNLDWVEKYGTEVTLFNQMNDLRLKEQILPTFNKFFSSPFRAGFNLEDLRKGSIGYVALHELAHNDLYYKNAAKNLGDLLSPIYELNANVLGLRMAGSLLLKDIIANKELESMIIAFMCRCFYLIEKSKQNTAFVNYGTGGTIFINFMLQSGALKQYKGLIITNFTKIFLSIQDLSYALEYLLSSGTRKNAEAFIKKYGKTELSS